jgi:CheY-like chemotaxis protein/anti-sigma regulatory factor (Ser/Thr protein kinase)
MLQAGEMSPDRTRHAIDIISRNARLQAQLIEDILDVSRIITGKLDIDRLPVVMPQLIEAVVGGVLPAAEARKIEVVKHLPDTAPLIEGDPKRLHQVLNNVLSNALKFTPDGGRIEVSCTAAPEAMEIRVRDSGTGIDPEFLPYIFDRFRQADSRSTRKHGGLGLGLAIARHLVEQHGGEIRAQSPGVGRGTTVTIRLPIRSLPVSSSAVSSRLFEPHLEPRLEGSLVVVVDDQEDSRELLTEILERSGAQVVRCDSVEAALDALRIPAVDLLVADIAMPHLDGYDLIRRVRQLPSTVPAVAVSAYARSQDRDKAFALGYNGYCAKPIETQQFMRTVRDVMRPS